MPEETLNGEVEMIEYLKNKICQSSYYLKSKPESLPFITAPHGKKGKNSHWKVKHTGSVRGSCLLAKMYAREFLEFVRVTGEYSLLSDVVADMPKKKDQTMIEYEFLREITIFACLGLEAIEHK